jgi:hypothetical protein
MADMLMQISNFFTEKAAKKGGADFHVLYDMLTSYSNGFGMKRGVMPIYIAAVLHLYKKNLVILYKGNEMKITPELLNDINESPKEYSVILEDWNDERASYMEQLEKVFSEYVSEREKSYNSFTYLMLAMNRWYLSLPKFAKEAVTSYKANGDTSTIAKEKRKFIGCLKQLDTNPREFLFETVFEIFGYKEFSELVVDNIKATKTEYDNTTQNLIAYLSGVIKELFVGRKKNSSLTSIIKDWNESLSEKTRQYLFPGNESRILELMKNITNDENSFVQRIAKAVSFLRIDDWNSETVDVFLRDLKAFKTTVEDFNNRKIDQVQGTAAYEIIFTGANGERIPKRFDKAEYSDRAKLLLNEISTALEEMGQSITEQEKRQVLVELLEKLC